MRKKQEMMNKVLRDQPEDPLLYLIKALYKKKGMEVPPELKLGAHGLRKSSPERILRRSKSPDISRRTASQHWVSSSADAAPGREYEKPWQSHSKKVKSKETEERSPPKPETFRKSSKYLHSKGNIRPHSCQNISSKSGTSSPGGEVTPQVSFNISTPSISKFSYSPNIEDILQVTPITPGRKQKQAWNSDNKPTSSTFDELFEGKIQDTKPVKKDSVPADSRKAWASIGLGEGDDGKYSSTNYRGPRRARLEEEEDPLAGEIQIAKPSEKAEKIETKSIKHVKGRKVDAKKHRKELEKLLQERASDDSGYIEDEEDKKEEDAIELLEDGEELRREGARHISKDGYKLSRIMKERQQEPNVKLNINLYTGPQPSDSFMADDYTGGENLTDFEDDRPPTGLSGYNPSPGDSDVDEEFESVSQVTGPRRPVWNVMDSDGESYQPQLSKTLPEPTRSSKYGRGLSDKKFASTVPVRFEEPPSRSMESTDSFLLGGKTWSPGMEQKDFSGENVQESVRSERGGWQLPRYESDTSLAEWSSTGKSQSQRYQPRAY